MQISTIGGPRGIFEILVPGVFLLLNLVGVLYVFPFAGEEVRGFIESCASRPVLSLLIVVCFGYLAGVIMRLLKADFLDTLSAKWHRMFGPAQAKDRQLDLWRTEGFPYIGWIGLNCQKYLPPQASEFYHETWAHRKFEVPKKNKLFFNFCKALVISVDERSSSEVHAAESISRYLSGIFYSLSIASFSIFVTMILQFVLLGKLSTFLLLVLVFYLLVLLAIIMGFRFIRIKEVETLFAATFRHRSRLLDDLRDDSAKRQETKEHLGISR